MPLYEYECKQCHRRTEKIQKFSDPEITVCPHCGGELERTVTAAAFSLKGSGWYKDLYSSAKPAAAASDASTPAAASVGESKSDSASAAPAAPSTPAPAAAPAAAPSTSAAKS